MNVTCKRFSHKLQVELAERKKTSKQRCARRKLKSSNSCTLLLRGKAAGGPSRSGIGPTSANIIACGGDPEALIAALALYSASYSRCIDIACGHNLRFREDPAFVPSLHNPCKQIIASCLISMRRWHGGAMACACLA